MAYDVRPVTSRAAWRDFLSLPRRLYRDDPVWVPSLDREVCRALDDARNPYFRSARLGLFLCFRNGQAVARTTTVVHPAYVCEDGRMPALFGYFESENDPEAVHTLFQAAGEWCARHGATDLHGPFHPHHYSEMGLQLDGFSLPVTFFQTHHPHFYRGLLEGTGFSIERVIHTRRNPDIRAWLMQHPAPMVPTHDLRVRHFDLSHLPEELDRIREVYNDAFADNCYFLPVSRDEYLYSAAGLRLVTRPELNVIVEHGAEPVGVLQCMLDVNPLLQPMRGRRSMPLALVRFLTGRAGIRRLVVYAVGIKKKWQRGRVHALLFAALHQMAHDFDELETTWMSPDNPLALHAAARFGMKEDKHFAIFTRPLSGV